MSDTAVNLRPAEGLVAPEVADEFPGLRLHWATVDARRRDSPRAVVRQLKQLSSRYRGAGVVAMRTKPIPQAYRTFFRQIGLDPDVDRIPSEAVAVQRLLHGGLRPSDTISDACLIALVETGVPVWALDADRLQAAGPGIRAATEADAERVRDEERYLEPGTLVVADPDTVLCTLFGMPEAPVAVSGSTRRVALFTIGVQGVPVIHLEEAMWICLELLS